VHKPTRVYPISRKKRNKYKRGIQIVTYNNTSFLLTSGSSIVTDGKDILSGDESSDGKEDEFANDYGNDVYGWGDNENGLLMTDKPNKTRPKKIPLKNSAIAKIDVQHGHFVGYLIGSETNNFDDSEDYGDSDNEYNDNDEEKKDLVLDLGPNLLSGAGQGKGPGLLMGNKLLKNTQKQHFVQKAAPDTRRNSVAGGSVSGRSNGTSRRSSRSRYGGGIEQKALQPYFNMVNKVQDILKAVDKSLRKKTDRISNPSKDFTKETENQEDEERNDSDNDSIPDTSEDYMGRIVIEYLQALGKC
jgi:hypothetical protein